MARKPAFEYNRNHKDYVALEKLPAPIRFALYESMGGYSTTTLLKDYNKLKRLHDSKVAIQIIINTIRKADRERIEVRAAKYDKPIVAPLYNYRDHVVFYGMEAY